MNCTFTCQQISSFLYSQEHTYAPVWLSSPFSHHTLHTLWANIVVCLARETTLIVRTSIGSPRSGYVPATPVTFQLGPPPKAHDVRGRLILANDGTCAETRFRLSAIRTSPSKSRGVTSLQSTAGSRGVRISGSNAGYTVFRRSVKGTGYPLHSPVSPSLPLPCVTVCHHISKVVMLHTPCSKVV